MTGESKRAMEGKEAKRKEVQKEEEYRKERNKGRQKDMKHCIEDRKTGICHLHWSVCIDYYTELCLYVAFTDDSEM